MVQFVWLNQVLIGSGGLEALPFSWLSLEGHTGFVQLASCNRDPWRRHFAGFSWNAPTGSFYLGSGRWGALGQLACTCVLHAPVAFMPVSKSETIELVELLCESVLSVFPSLPSTSSLQSVTLLFSPSFSPSSLPLSQLLGQSREDRKPSLCPHSSRHPQNAGQINWHRGVRV